MTTLAPSKPAPPIRRQQLARKHASDWLRTMVHGYLASPKLRRWIERPEGLVIDDPGDFSPDCAAYVRVRALPQGARVVLCLSWADTGKPITKSRPFAAPE
jgi:hypothetical protein